MQKQKSKKFRTENLAAGAVLDFLIAQHELRAVSVIMPGDGRYHVIDADGRQHVLPYYSSDEELIWPIIQREKITISGGPGDYCAQAPARDGRPDVLAYGMTENEAAACCVAIRYAGSWCDVPPELIAELNCESSYFDDE